MGSMANLARPRQTVEDYLALPDDVRGELIDGVVYLMTPAPNLEHQDIVVALTRWLRAHADDTSVGRVFVAPTDVHLASGDIVQPDLLLLLEPHFDATKQFQAYNTPPDLAVEVLSPTRPERDRIVKRHLYAQNGVTEYWIADPETRSVEVLRREEAVYTPAGWFRHEDLVVSPLLPGLRIPLTNVFR